MIPHDLNMVPTRSEADIQLLFNPGEILIVLAEQEGQEAMVRKFQQARSFAAAVLGGTTRTQAVASTSLLLGGKEDENSSTPRPSWTNVPAREFGWAEEIITGMIWPRKRSAVNCGTVT